MKLQSPWMGSPSHVWWEHGEKICSSSVIFWSLDTRMTHFQGCLWHYHHLQTGPTSSFGQFRPLFEDKESEVQRRCKTWLKLNDNLPVTILAGMKDSAKVLLIHFLWISDYWNHEPKILECLQESCARRKKNPEWDFTQFWLVRPPCGSWDNDVSVMGRTTPSPLLTHFALYLNLSLTSDRTCWHFCSSPCGHTDWISFPCLSLWFVSLLTYQGWMINSLVRNTGPRLWPWQLW